MGRTGDGTCSLEPLDHVGMRTLGDAQGPHHRSVNAYN